MSDYDFIGNIAILKFKRGTKQTEKKKFARKLLKQKNIKTVLEKVERVKGRLRTIKTRFLAGKNTRETIHKESNCKFKLDVDKCYFSPRLSNDRIEIARKIKVKDKVLVMFSGVAPYPIVIAKIAKPKKIVAIEINKIASRYAKENALLNKLENIEIVQGDVKRILPGLAKKEKFDKIVMTRPNLKESFLKPAFLVSKKNTEIFYHGFGKTKDEIIENIKKEALKYRKKIKILQAKKIGDIAPYKHRFRVEIRVL